MKGARTTRRVFWRQRHRSCGAVRAVRLARLAHIAAVQDQPVMGVLLELGGTTFSNLSSTARGPAGRDRCGWRRGRCGCPPRWWVRRRRCSAPHWRSCVRRRAGPRARRGRAAPRRRGARAGGAQGDEVLRLGIERPIVVEMYFLTPSSPSANRAAGVFGHWEQAACGLVHADVRGLGGQHHGDQQLEGAAVLQPRSSVAVEFAQAAE